MSELKEVRDALELFAKEESNSKDEVLFIATEALTKLDSYIERLNSDEFVKEVELENCPFCGTDDLELWHGLGTQADICCNDCGRGYIEIQVSDYFTYEERFGGDFDFDMETAKYSEKGVKRGMEELVKAWNTRHPTKREQKLIEALKEVTDDLEAEIKDRYAHSQDYPSEMRKCKRDMEPVLKAQAILKEIGEG
jgi:DNA-binding transcriptional MerR regulator